MKRVDAQTKRQSFSGPADRKCAAPEDWFPSANDKAFDQPIELSLKSASDLSRGFSHTSGEAFSKFPLRIRNVLSDDVGSGYCEDFWISDQMGVSITDATYHKDQWINVDSARRFTIKLLLSGDVLDVSGAMAAQSPQGHVQVSAETSADGFFVAAQRETKMVVLYCNAELLTDVFGLNREGTPSPFNRVFDGRGGSVSQNFKLTSKLARAAQHMMDSQLEMPQPLRIPMVEAISREVLCAVLGEFAKSKSASCSHLKARDLNRIHEVKDYLSEHFVAPPNIEALAVQVGMNQTKLKQGFRDVFGTTIYGHILALRMDRASELLLTTDKSVAEVAYQVGYDYPANFTSAFKRHFGKLPRQWKQS